MSRIFISYRHEESSGHAGRLRDRLIDRFGEDQVFMDIDTLEPGEDFVDVIQQSVASCAVLLAVIGRHWAAAADSVGRRRLENPEDFVRIEIAAALDRNVRVIPLLVQGASMPLAEELPEALRKLARRHALELSDARWRGDTDRLLGVLEKVLGSTAPPSGVQAPVEEARSDSDEQSAARRWQPEVPRAAVWVVDASGRGTHTTLGDAIRQAGTGDRIEVKPGVYREALVMDKPLDIVGVGANRDEVVIEASDMSALVLNSPFGRVAHLSLRSKQSRGGSDDALAVDAPCVEIVQGIVHLEDCDIASETGDCVAIHGADADPVISSSRIHDGLSGVYVYDTARGTLENNDVVDNSADAVAVAIATGADPVLWGNTIHDNPGGGVLVRDDGRGTLENNEIWGQTDSAAVGIKTGGDPVLRGNKIHDNQGGGVFVLDNGRGTLENNEIWGHPPDVAAVTISTGGDPVLRGNKIHNNLNAGVYIYDDGRGTVENNDLRGNNEGALVIEASSKGKVKDSNNQK